MKYFLVTCKGSGTHLGMVELDDNDNYFEHAYNKGKYEIQELTEAEFGTYIAFGAFDVVSDTRFLIYWL